MSTRFKNQSRGGSRRLLPGRPLLVGGMAFALAGCPAMDRLLEVQDPTVAAPGTIAVEAAVPTTLNAAVGSFAHAFSGSPGAGSFIDSQITLSATLSDEFNVPDSFPTRIEIDQRATQIQNATAQGAYARLHTARTLAERAVGMHEQFEAHRNTTGHAHALNLLAYTYILFGENYCSGVPFSRVLDDGSIEFGEPLSTQQMFERAIEFFDRARPAAQAALTAAQAMPAAPAAARTAAINAATQQLNLSRVGKARALLNRGQAGDRAAAATEVADVPVGFVYQIFHAETTTRQQNGTWGANTSQRRLSPSDREGGNGLPYRSDNDPRVRTQRGTGGRAVGFDASTPFWDQLKYPDRGTPVVLASGVEARLIVAENQLATGGPWLATLNALRASPPAYFPAARFPDIGTLAPLTGAEAATPLDLLYRERAYWMWLTSSRLGDLRRLMRQYGRTDAQAGFPTGAYFKGGTYGNHVNLPVPFDELNNPHFSEGMCDPSRP